MKPAGLGFLVAFLSSVFAQTPSIITSVGYSSPSPVAVAPGQVITLFARTKTTLTQPVVASSSTLPTTLGGFSVALTQTFSSDPIAVPIFSAAPVVACTEVAPSVCTTSTAISIQIPFELGANVQGAHLPENFAALTVTDNGDIGEPIGLNPVSAQIHILNSCDTPLNPQSGPCNTIFQHADGSLVSAANPAAAGETITLQAYGLGLGDSRIPTGMPSPSPAVSVSGVAVDFRFGTDIAITTPGPNASTLAAQFVPGSVGLYQLAFTVPMAPAGTPGCSAITNNLTVVIGRGNSFDGASLCMQQSDSKRKPSLSPSK